MLPVDIKFLFTLLGLAGKGSSLPFSMVFSCIKLIVISISTCTCTYSYSGPDLQGQQSPVFIYFFIFLPRFFAIDIVSVYINLVPFFLLPIHGEEDFVCKGNSSFSFFVYFSGAAFPLGGASIIS